MGYARILYLNRVTPATITSSAEDTGYPDDNVINWRDYVRWHASGANAYWIKADYGSQIEVTSFAIAGHNLNTVGARLKLEGSNNDVNWTNIVAYTTTGNDICLERCFTGVTYRYYRLDIDNNGGANFSPQIGVYFVGSYLEFPELINYPFDPDRQEDHSSSQRGESGNLLGVVNDWTERSFPVTFMGLSQSFIANTWEPYWDDYRFQPFIWLWDYTNYQAAAYLMAYNTDIMEVPFTKLWRQPLTLEMMGKKEE